MKICIICLSPQVLALSAIICINQAHAAEFKWKLCCTLNGPYLDEHNSIDTCKTSSWLYYPQNMTGDTFTCPAGTNAVYPSFRIHYDDSTKQLKIRSVRHKDMPYRDLDIRYEIPNIENGRYALTIQTISYGNHLEYNYREANSYLYTEPLVIKKIYSNCPINDCKATYAHYVKRLADGIYGMIASVFITWIYNHIIR